MRPESDEIAQTPTNGSSTPRMRTRFLRKRLTWFRNVRIVVVALRSRGRGCVEALTPPTIVERLPTVEASLVNARRFRLAMTHSYRTFVRSGCPRNRGRFTG